MITRKHHHILDNAERVSKQYSASKEPHGTTDLIVHEDEELTVAVNPHGGILIALSSQLPDAFFRALRKEIERRRKGRSTPVHRQQGTIFMTYVPK